MITIYFTGLPSIFMTACPRAGSQGACQAQMAFELSIFHDIQLNIRYIPKKHVVLLPRVCSFQLPLKRKVYTFHCKFQHCTSCSCPCHKLNAGSVETARIQRHSNARCDGVYVQIMSGLLQPVPLRTRSFNLVSGTQLQL